MTQNQRILSHLKRYKTITRLQASKNYGVLNLWARIRELKDDGHPINGIMMDAKNRYGDNTRVKCYYLATRSAA